MINITDFSHSQHSICILDSKGATYCDLSCAINSGTITVHVTDWQLTKYEETNLIPYHVVSSYINPTNSTYLVDCCGVAVKKAEKIFLNYCIDLRKDKPEIDFYAVCINRVKYKDLITGRALISNTRFNADIYVSNLKKPFISIPLNTFTPIGEFKIDNDNPFIIKNSISKKEVDGVYLNPSPEGNCFSIHLDVEDQNNLSHGFKAVTFNTKSDVVLLYSECHTNIIHYVKDTKNNRFLIDNSDPYYFSYGSHYYNAIRTLIKEIFFGNEEKPAYFISDSTLKNFILPPNLFHYIQSFNDKKGIFLCTYIVMLKKGSDNIKDSRLNNINNCSNLNNLFIRGDYMPAYRRWEKLKKDLESYIDYDINNSSNLYTEKISSGPISGYNSIVLSVLMDYTGNFCVFKNNIESLPRTNSYPFLEEIDGVFYIKPNYYYKKVIL